MLIQLRTSVLMLVTLTLLTGVIYPLTVTGIAQLVFPHQANGSLMTDGTRLIGSELIGQHFSDPKYFWGRLSATGSVPYNAAASSGSNYGPLHPDLRSSAEQRIAALTAHGLPEAAIPVELVTASGSGLDPHISPAAAEFQVARVARIRGLTETEVRGLLQRYTIGRSLRVLGEPCVHVLQLNSALDELR